MRSGRKERAELNIATLLRRSAADRPDAVALRLDDVEIDYAGFAEQGARFAAHLRASGVRPGDRVGFFLPNCLEYLVGLLGTWQAGAVGVPLNHMFPDDPLRYAIEDSGVTVLVLTADDRDRVGALLDGGGPELLTTGPDGGFAAAVAAHEPMGTVVPRLDRDDACLMYTSGSTGKPKGVRQTHRNIAAEVDGAIDFYELTADDHVLNCMPLFHVGGLQLASLPILVRGGQITFMPRWDVVRWIELAQRLRPTYGGLISTMMIDVGNRTVKDPVVLDSFRICMFGGSRTPSAAIARLEAGTGIVGVEIYGQTEQNGLVVSYRAGDTRRPDSMGRPLEQIVDPRLVPVDGGPDLHPGDDGVGELWVRGDAVTPGYWNIDAPEKWSDGWFRTGDLVSTDADGYLYYVDRIDDMIVSGGENVFPQMVEEHLAARPDLAEVAVIGTAHERWVEQVTAVVVPNRDGVTAEAVADWCATNPNLRGMHKPRRIEVVEALPRTGSGKLNRPDLRRMFP
ncbi:Long-chain-fatty-acid--CoA ligase [Pseudonocardia sp. Ae168_Ps1]|nr:Long-chain-fatty-acid--CoA ligase [Pseudonocardia sp. Ae150A_Ps1]OLL78345.1 Long-chain-fatty-acid--CoA ligase [Pseudonocardia sp. Ae168_Ps1]OLL87529.1 Long-chain-fatty-acid--CoA ligase [Pseudonocardia sp. Ae263_Ps1]OLL92441.1 Long-chain-fatty-acid--CoA ligase [Pseudonocardia sp. Ae356_Ps1]